MKTAKGITLSLAEKLAALKDQFADHLCEPELLKQPEGLKTGFAPLDRFLVSSGIPKGALSLFKGALGTGSTSLWLDTAAEVVKAGRWVAWVNESTPLLPQSLQHKGINLSRFIAVDAVDSDEKLFWTLQELMSTALFGLIGCDLGERALKEHQLRKLHVQARDSQVALVFLSQSKRKLRGAMASTYSLILGFEKKQIVVERAQHRPTPYSLVRSVSYARFTHHVGSFTNTAQSALDAGRSHDQSND